MNFKKFNDIGDSEPRAWNKDFIGSRFTVDEDEEDEIPVPYCDEFDDEMETEDDTDEQLEEDETETETESITSIGKPIKRVLKNTGPILQEETDFMQE